MSEKQPFAYLGIYMVNENVGLALGSVLKSTTNNKKINMVYGKTNILYYNKNMVRSKTVFRGRHYKKPEKTEIFALV